MLDCFIASHEAMCRDFAPAVQNASRAVVGVAVLRGGAIVRTGTGTVVDVSGLVITANHHVDRVVPGDVIVVAVPSEQMDSGECNEATSEASARAANTVLQLDVACSCKRGQQSS